MNDRATDHDGGPGILLEDCSVEAEGGNKLAPLLVRQGAEWRARVVLMHLGPQYGAGLRPAKFLALRLLSYLTCIASRNFLLALSSGGAVSESRESNSGNESTGC